MPKFQCRVNARSPRSGARSQPTLETVTRLRALRRSKGTRPLARQLRRTSGCPGDHQLQPGLDANGEESFLPRRVLRALSGASSRAACGCGSIKAPRCPAETVHDPTRTQGNASAGQHGALIDPHPHAARLEAPLMARNTRRGRNDSSPLASSPDCS